MPIIVDAANIETRANPPTTQSWKNCQFYRFITHIHGADLYWAAHHSYEPFARIDTITLQRKMQIAIPKKKGCPSRKKK